jgi:TRAP-type uncharacterized transport system fused permease subunit
MDRQPWPVALALLVALMIFYIMLGCFLDGISIVVLTMAVLMPTIESAGIDLLWFGIFVVVVVEMAQITPPVGFNLFVLQGMTKKEPCCSSISSPASSPGCRSTWRAEHREPSTHPAAAWRQRLDSRVR